MDLQFESRILEAIRDRIDSDPELSKGKKRKLKRKLARRRVQVTVLDYVTSEAIGAQLIDPTDPDDRPERDWESFLRFLEGLFELILRFINAFPS